VFHAATPQLSFEIRTFICSMANTHKIKLDASAAALHLLDEVEHEPESALPRKYAGIDQADGFTRRRCLR
jgi:hypothetical protein